MALKLGEISFGRQNKPEIFPDLLAPVVHHIRLFRVVRPLFNRRVYLVHDCLGATTFQQCTLGAGVKTGQRKSSRLPCVAIWCLYELENLTSIAPSLASPTWEQIHEFKRTARAVWPVVPTSAKAGPAPLSAIVGMVAGSIQAASA